MKDLILTEQVICPICNRKFTGIVRFDDGGHPSIICINRRCNYRFDNEYLTATVGQQNHSYFETLAAGKWPAH